MYIIDVLFKSGAIAVINSKEPPLSVTKTTSIEKGVNYEIELGNEKSGISKLSGIISIKINKENKNE